MPLVVPPLDVCKIAVNGKFVDASFTNVFHVLAGGSGAATAADRLAMLEGIVEAGYGALTGTMSDGVEILTAEVTSSDGTATSSLETGFTGLTGAVSGTPIDASSCGVISWQGEWAYRGGKPRTYVCGLTAAALDSPQRLTTSYATSLAENASTFLANVASGFPYGSITDGALGALLGNTLTSAGTFAPFAGLVVRPQICSQRRRLRG